MQSRMKNPALVLSEALPLLQTLGALPQKQGRVPEKTLGLTHLRASQINGCALCIEMHTHMAKKVDETLPRLLAVAAWRESPHFTEAERAALALTEAITRIADQSDRVPDDVWNEAARHFDEQAMASLVLAISATNLFNRLNVATRQIPGEVKWEDHMKK